MIHLKRSHEYGGLADALSCMPSLGAWWCLLLQVLLLLDYTASAGIAEHGRKLKH